MNQTPTQRLASLDILRGFDLFLLVFFQPVVVSLLTRLNIPWMSGVLYQLDHEVWEGFRFWDLIMPLFLFMSGVSLPFSLEKYKGTTEKGFIYKKIIKRFVILFILGMVVQGNLLGLDLNHIYLYSNTLQAIATGYIVTALLVLHLSFKQQIGAAAFLLIIYSVPMMLLGDFTPDGNFAEKVDRLVLGRFRDGVYWDENGAWHFAPGYTYTWIWSSLTFIVTVLLGALAGELMKKGKDNRCRTAAILLGTGIVLVILGWLCSFQIPVIKRIWTSSMTLLSGGYCFLLMGAFYYVIDCKGYSHGWNWLKIYGMNSITAYMLGECVNFRSVAASVFYGTEQYLGNYYPVWLSFCNFLIVFLILRLMYKQRVFLKI